MEIVKSLTAPNRNETAKESPFMSFEEVVALLPGMTVAGLRKEIERGSELGRELKPFVVKLSERRRYLKRSRFMDWLQAKSQ